MKKFHITITSWGESYAEYDINAVDKQQARDKAKIDKREMIKARLIVDHRSAIKVKLLK